MTRFSRRNWSLELESKRVVEDLGISMEGLKEAAEALATPMVNAVISVRAVED